MPADEILAGENVDTGILLIHRRQILGLDKLTRVVVEGLSIPVIEAGMQGGDGKEGIVGGIVRQEGLDGARDGLRPEERIGAVGLQVKIGFGEGGVIEKDVVHGDGVGAEMLGAVHDTHGGISPAEAAADGVGVGINQDPVDLGDAQESLNDVLVERFASEQAEVLAEDALAVVTHGDEGEDTGHVSSIQCSVFSK
jgi:hypothetical protein